MEIVPKYDTTNILAERIEKLINDARKRTIAAVNTTMVYPIMRLVV